MMDSIFALLVVVAALWYIVWTQRKITALERHVSVLYFDLHMAQVEARRLRNAAARHE